MKCNCTPESEISNTMDFMKVGALQGWQCPQCGRIYGPFVQECYHCNSFESTLTTTTAGTGETITMKYPEDFIKTDKHLNDIPHCYCVNTKQPKHMKGDK